MTDDRIQLATWWHVVLDDVLGQKGNGEADFFFFQAEDGIRDLIVTGVQTCALPICHAVSVTRENAAASAQLSGGTSVGITATFCSGTTTASVRVPGRCSPSMR